MGVRSYMQLKDSAGGNIFELKGWRWDRVLDRFVKLHPLKSFPGASSVNETLALDFGDNARKYALMGRLLTNRQFNSLRTLVRDTYFEKAPVTLTIGTGAHNLTPSGVVSNLHVDWSEGNQYYTATIGFIEGVVFPI
jgi:hypothetical protein